jgi:hypothetical protein
MAAVTAGMSISKLKNIREVQPKIRVQPIERVPRLVKSRRVCK